MPAGQLSADQRKVVAELVAPAMSSINQLFDKVLAIPGVGEVVRPTVETDQAGRSLRAIVHGRRTLNARKTPWHPLRWPVVPRPARRGYHSRRSATIAHKRMGTARNAPTGPHTQLQIAMERKT